MTVKKYIFFLTFFITMFTNSANGLNFIPRRIQIISRDGTVIRGIAEITRGTSHATVIMVAGTGLFDRDVEFGRSASNRDRLFLDLSNRLIRRGLTVVRYDRRGTRHIPDGHPIIVPIEAGTATVASLRDDLAAIYNWVRSESGLQEHCVVFLAHSEGMRHVAGLAEIRAPTPLLVVGIGAPMRSPVEIMYWQLALRPTYALRMMDSDHDGTITSAEIEANWRHTPAGGFPAFGSFRYERSLTEADLARLENTQSLLYERERREALALDDDAPFPNVDAPVGRASWWKSWFTDTTPIAARLSAWQTRVILHYGTIDSQLAPNLEASTARAILGSRVSVQLHNGMGHSLGTDALLAPMDETIAEGISDEIARASQLCRR